MVVFSPCASGTWRGVGQSARLLAGLILSVAPMFGRMARGQIEMPRPQLNAPISIAADAALRWQEGAYEVLVLRGHCSIEQAQTTARSEQAVLWIQRGPADSSRPSKVIAYLEGGVTIDAGHSTAAGRSPEAPVGRVTGRSWFGRFYTRAPLAMRLPTPGPEPTVKPPIFRRGLARFDPAWAQAHAVRPAQLAEPVPAPSPLQPLPPGTRRIRFNRRNDVPVQARWLPSPTGDQWVAIVGPGINLIVDGLDAVVEGVGTVQMIDIDTDWLVLWTTGLQPDVKGQTLQNRETPLEIYMEGNIVFRQGDRTIYARQMYYDVRRSVGVVLDAEILTPVPQYQGLLRLKSQVVRQLDASRFQAQNAMLTSSRLGAPSYSLRSDMIAYQDIQHPAVDPLTGIAQIDPQTGAPRVDHQRMATSQNNFLYLGGIPVFYWPTLATDLKRPQYYINNVALKNDRVFGTQVRFDLDAYQLLGIRDPPAGTDWSVDFDYMRDRGFGYGTQFDYNRPDFFLLPGPTQGKLDGWFIKDHGEDNLGRDRRNVPPETDNRGRVLWYHRQHLPRNFTLTAELGWISDRNFLEQYYEREWDEWKDQTTDIELKQAFDNQSWNILASARLNDFFTETEWLPRLDHFWMGQSLLGDRLTWFEHSQASYARLRPATAPTNPVDAAIWSSLPWEAAVQGERLVTRQEIDLPLELGPAKVVPYALGELAHWGEGLDSKPIDRAYVQAGMRASLPFWAVNPAVENQLLNVHGLAHKVVLDADFSYADSSKNLDDLPLYDPINDHSTQAFERVFPFTTFHGPVPPQFESPFYALRSGVQGWVAAPTTEIADDLIALRMGMQQRWQTKRGHAGARRIIDWVTLDTNAVWFPDANRDNFGTAIGLADYDFRWHVGDRVTLVSDGGFDFFSQGLQTVSVGGFLTRPPRGSAYLGYRVFTGPFKSNVLSTSYAYWMSPKWVSTLGSSIDFGSTGNIGQTFSITRIGESLLVTLGFNYDASKGSGGVKFLVEPRFLPRPQLNNRPGLEVPPAGAFGLE